MKGKVLIVDDDPIMGNLLEVRLTEAGFEAQFFDNGEEALASIHQIKPDIIISDIVMPNMNGYELHRRLRQNSDTAGIPFVFLSAKAEAADQLRGLRMGADDYVCKPFKIEDLIERMGKVIEGALKAKAFQSQADFSGNLNQMKLNDVLQVVELNHKSGQLILNAPDSKRIGRVVFKNGKLINAQRNNIKGTEAFFSLMEETEGFFEFYGGVTDDSEQITDTNRAILLRASHLIVESKKLYARLPNLNIVLVRNAVENTSDSANMLTIENRAGKEKLETILSMIDAQQTVGKIIDCGFMSRLTAAAILSDLISAGVLSIPEQEIYMENNVLSETSHKDSESEVFPEFSEEPAFDHALVASVIDENLLNVLKACEKNALTGILLIENLPEKAAIYFQDGSIVHAYYKEMKAKKGLYRIFSSRGGIPRFHRQSINVYNAIDEPLNFLLEEGAKEIEMLRQVKSDIFENFIAVNPYQLKKFPKIRTHQGMNYLLSLVEQHGRIRDIIDASQMIDLHTYKNLMFMVKAGILRIESKKRLDIQIVTDSSTDLPADVMKHHNIISVPLSVMFEQNSYRDGIDLTPENFYPLLENSKAQPTISPPSEQDFDKLFADTVSEKDIIGIFMSDKMGNSIELAQTAKEKHYDVYLKQRQEKYQDKNPLYIEIIDSQLVSLGTGLLVIEAAEKIQQGWETNQIREHIENLIPKIRVVFVPDTPDYLEQSGHIRKTSAFKHHLLNIRPILSLWQGEMIEVDQIKGEKNAWKQVAELLQQSMDDPDTPLKLGIMHAEAPKRAEQIKELLKKQLNCQDIIVSYMGPAMGMICGPGSVGVACMPVIENG